MDRAHLLVFATAYLVVLVLPGPGVTALVARVMARGTQGCPAFITGFVIGPSRGSPSRQLALQCSRQPSR
jgi:threonine/homoserine/homoserine lactone efflux protein